MIKVNGEIGYELIANMLEEKINRGEVTDLENRLFWDYSKNGESVFRKEKYREIVHVLTKEVEAEWAE